MALDIGPGHTISDAIRIAKALEPMNLMWLEDIITGDYTPYVLADLYREVTMNTTTPTTVNVGFERTLRGNLTAISAPSIATAGSAAMLTERQCVG